MEAVMIQLIPPECYAEFTYELAQIYQLRYRVFNERLGSDVQISDDMFGEFDLPQPAYLLQRSTSGGVRGCVGLLPPRVLPCYATRSLPCWPDRPPTKSDSVGEQSFRTRYGGRRSVQDRSRARTRKL